MRRLETAVLLLLFVFPCASCEQADVPSYVYGTLQGNFLNTGQPTLKFQGALSKKDTINYGFCEYKGNKFSFVVATNALSDSNIGADVYIAISGIEGPPENGTYENGAPKRDESLRTTFQQAFINKTYSWIVGPDELAAARDQCYVALFAESKQGELIKGKDQPFDYYVRINCDGLDVVPEQGNGITLQYFALEFYFRGC